MADPHTDDPLGDLAARGLIAREPPPRPLPQSNLDRRAEQAHASWAAFRPDGTAIKVSLGRGLRDRAERQTAFARACPGLVPAVLWVEALARNEALAEEYFDGFTLEAALEAKRLAPEQVRAALGRIAAALAATETPSDEASRLAEWQAWSARLTGLPVWQTSEARLLRSTVLPRLYPRLASAPPATRWTNGDFLGTNILLNPGGETRLIDTEFAAQTHFPAEDSVRFRALSPAVRVAPEVFAGVIAEPDLPWHLYFWLRQLQLEVENNTADYLARVLPLRLGSLRRLAEHVLDTSLDGWSVAAIEIHHRLEEARWSPVNEPMMRLAGWCHAPALPALNGVVALDGGRCIARSGLAAREDVQQHFGGEARARRSGFTLETPPVRADARITLCAVHEPGVLLPFLNLAAQDLPQGTPRWDDYAAWAAEQDPDPPAPAAGEKATGPLFSILLPVYNPPLPFLRACLASVLAQHYPRWELCLVDDASSDPAVADCVRQFAAGDPRVRVQARKENGGISRASNDALADATGDFIVLLDHDDLLRPHALLEFARHLAREPAADAVYSDEDKVTAEGRRLLPLLKPGFSPEFLLRVMYVGHALAVRTAVARAAGGFDSAFDGVQDYEFFLRVTARTANLGHIPRILYHWRQSPASSALLGNVKGDMDQKQAAAVRAHLARQGRREQVLAAGGHRVELRATEVPSSEIFQAGSAEDPVAALRRAAAVSRADVVVLQTTEPLRTSDGWLAGLVALAGRPDSACVAPVILSREDRVLEAGWTLGAAGGAPIMRGFDRAGDGYHGSLRCSREVAAVSPLCVALRREILTTILSETPLGKGWFDFCLRLRDRGLFHRVCATSQFQVDISSRDEPSTAASPSRKDTDPFFNCNFDSRHADYRLRNDLVAPVPQWHLDTELATAAANGCLLWRGWCFVAGSPPIRAIRLRAGPLTLTGVVGLPRPDVRAALPRAPDDNTGFELRGILTAGRHALTLEAQTSDGNWHFLLARTVAVRRRLLPRWLGGGDWTELMFFQMPAHMAYPPRPVRPERFPSRRDSSARPRFAIVTPSFQQARFLGETMRSVLGQENVTCDYVVQDGGSTDGSVEVIKGFAQADSAQPSNLDPQLSVLNSQPSTLNSQPASSPRPRLVAWASEPDRGQADAINRGFAKTAGAPDDVMAWLNSDDFYLPGALGFVADHFSRHPEVDVLYGYRIVVNEESREIARWFLPRHDDAVLRLNDFVPQETVFWRRRSWEKIGGLDPSFKFAMDWDFLLRLRSAGARIVRVPYFLACFRVHPGQKTSAAMHDVGRHEIDLLRSQANGREIPATTLERNTLLLRYLRRSAAIEFLWKSGIRAH